MIQKPILDQDKFPLILLGTVIFHHIYILIRDTVPFHGMILPSVEIWTLILLIPLGILSYNLLNIPAKDKNIQALYIAIIFSLTSTILRVFIFSTDFITYGIFLILISILIIIALYKENEVMIIGYIITSIFGIILLLGDSFEIIFINSQLSNLLIFFELSLLLSIIAYNIYLKPSLKQLAIIILTSLLGLIIGLFVINLNNTNTNTVPASIIKIVFEQTLGISQFSVLLDFQSINLSISEDYIFALHFLEIFNILALVIVKRRSIPAISIILTGLDMSYPPLSAMRAIAVLLYLRSKNNFK